MCNNESGAPFEPFADQFVGRLGPEALVSRASEATADHMVQEAAPERVVAAIRRLIEAAP
ncbi:MAG: hypothetical protein AAFU79_24270 [Myxococcota bacterium]